MSRFISASAIASALLVILGSAALYGAIAMGIGTPDIPDAGFFPLLAALALTLLALVQLFGDIRKLVPEKAASEAVAPPSSRMAFAVAAGLVAYVPALQWLGFLIATALLVTLILAVFGIRRWLPYLLAVPLIAGGSYGLFDLALGLPLPSGPLGF